MKILFSLPVLFITMFTADGFLLFTMNNCVFNSSAVQDVEFVSSIFYNKEEILRFTSSLGKFVGYTAFGVKQAEFLNKDDRILIIFRTRKQFYCVPNIQVDYKAALTKSVKPYVKIRSETPSAGQHPSLLVCSVYNFYPKFIKVSWTRDGQEVSQDVTSTDLLLNGDWYYQIHSHLEYTPRSGEKISCVVEHASLPEPLVTTWDPSLPESEKNKMAIGASGLTLGLILSLAGFMYYHRKVKGRVLVPSS